MNYLFYLFLLFFTQVALCTPVVNVYVWGGEIPKKLVKAFEAETGINVNFSTYDSNETMYAKLKASNNSIYDVVLPSGYFVERMVRQGMLEKLDFSQLNNRINIDPQFTNNDYDPGNHYSVPLIWGTTGIFFNQNKIKSPPSKWQQLWDKRWREQVMLLDDSREVFAIALMSLGYNPNDNDPSHIEAAFNHLLELAPNIKLFSNDGIQSIIIDEDANLGSAWNGDALKAHAENSAINFVYPEDGFVIWVDCLAIPKNPPHLKEALSFINFMLNAQNSAQIALIEGHAITNAPAQALLPDDIRNNPMIYPSAEILKRGYFQRDLGEDTLKLYNQYWQQLKLAF